VFCYNDVLEFHLWMSLEVLSQEQGTSTEIEREKEPDFVQLKCRHQQSEWYGLAILLTWYIFLPQYESTRHRACSQGLRTQKLKSLLKLSLVGTHEHSQD